MIITSSVVVNTYWLTSNLEVQNELYLGMAKLPCSLGGGGGEPNTQKNHAHTTPIILHLIKAGISFMYHYLPLRNLYGINIELWHLVNANQSILNFKWLHKFWEVLICWPSPLSCRHLSRTIVWRYAQPFWQVSSECFTKWEYHRWKGKKLGLHANCTVNLGTFPWLLWLHEQQFKQCTQGEMWDE